MNACIQEFQERVLAPRFAPRCCQCHHHHLHRLLHFPPPAPLAPPPLRRHLHRFLPPPPLDQHPLTAFATLWLGPGLVLGICSPLLPTNEGHERRFKQNRICRLHVIEDKSLQSFVEEVSMGFRIANANHGGIVENSPHASLAIT